MKRLKTIVKLSPRRHGAALLFGLALFFGPVHSGIASPAPQGKPVKNQRVTNMFYDTSLQQALADIASQTGTTIIPDETVRGFITCELVDVPLEEALKMVLSSGGFVFRKMEGYILVCSPDPESRLFYRISNTKAIRLNYLKAKDAVKMLPISLEKYAKANETNETVCITAPPEILERIITDLKSLDKPRRQVILEARIVELTRGYRGALGTDSWLWSSKDTEVSWNSLDGGFSLIHIDPNANTPEYTRGLMMRLSLLVENQSASIIASPCITAQHGVKSEIRVATEEYFLITGEGYYYRADLEKIESGIVLEVLPRVSDDGEITLEVSPEVSNVVGTGSENLPVITRRRVNTTVRVKDGGTAVIGGLVSNYSNKSKKRLPILGDIPLIGWLFRKDSVLDIERQITVFITPKIIDLKEGAGRKKIERKSTVQPVGAEFVEKLRLSLKRPPEEQ